MYIYIVTIADNVNIHIYTPINVGSFETKMCKFHNFFYYRHTDMNALRLMNHCVFHNSILSQYILILYFLVPYYK